MPYLWLTEHFSDPARVEQFFKRQRVNTFDVTLMRILLSAGLVLIATASFAQLSKKEKKAARQEQNQPTSLDPETNMPMPEVREPKHKTTKSAGPTYNSQKEFEQRMKARAKTNRRNEKLLMTPQFSNPLYFGHKKAPKRHSAKKMKFCQECGIRH